jgi:hypothetical protein
MADYMTTEVVQFDVDGHTVSITNVPFGEFNPNQIKFNGQKMHSPWLVDHDTTLYNRDEFKKVETEARLADCDQFELKHDGSCGALMWDGKNLIPYARFDIKQQYGKKIVNGDPFGSKLDTSQWIQCEPKPVVDDGPRKHWPHMRPISEEPKMYKHYHTAFNNSKSELLTHVVPWMNTGDVITIEYMGQSFNNPVYERLTSLRIVLHGSLVMNVPVELRTYDGFMKIFTEFPIIEGVVGYPSDGALFKIKGCYMGIKPDESDVANVLATHGLAKIPVEYAKY